MMKSDFNVLLASTGMLHCHASFTAMAAGIPSICMDGGMTARMVPVGRRHRRHEADRRAEALCGEARVRREREELPRHLAIRHRIQLSRRRPHHRAAAAVRRASTPTRSSTSTRTKTGQGNNLLLLSVPDRRVQRRAGRRQRQRQAGDRPDHASHRTAHDADRAHRRARPGRQDRRRADARILRDYLDVYGDDNAYMCPAEASVGVNAKAVVRGIQREDKNIMGTHAFRPRHQRRRRRLGQVEDPHGRRHTRSRRSMSTASSASTTATSWSRSKVEASQSAEPKPAT